MEYQRNHHDWIRRLRRERRRRDLGTKVTAVPQREKKRHTGIQNKKRKRTRTEESGGRIFL